MTMSYDTPVTYLTIKQYAEREDIAERTVTRRLKSGEIRGAYQDERGRWMIPAVQPLTADVVTLPSPKTRPTTEVVSHPSRVMPETAPIRDKGFYTLDEAAEILGISRHTIEENRGYFEVLPFGPGTARLSIARATIKQILG